MKFAVMFMLEEYPEYFLIEEEDELAIHRLIKETATLIVRNPTSAMAVKDRGGFLDQSLRKISSADEVLLWIDEALKEKPVEKNSEPRPFKLKIIPDPDPYTLVHSKEACIGLGVHSCPICGAPVEVWAYSKSADGVRTKAVMCTRNEAFGPQEQFGQDGCLLFLPPDEFYQPTVRESITYWNAWADATEGLRSGTTEE